MGDVVDVVVAPDPKRPTRLSENVIYVDAGPLGREPKAAVITKVFDNETVDLMVFEPASKMFEKMIAAYSSVPYDENAAAGTWHF